MENFDETKSDEEMRRNYAVSSPDSLELLFSRLHKEVQIKRAPGGLLRSASPGVGQKKVLLVNVSINENFSRQLLSAYNNLWISLLT